MKVVTIEHEQLASQFTDNFVTTSKPSKCTVFYGNKKRLHAFGVRRSSCESLLLILFGMLLSTLLWGIFSVLHVKLGNTLCPHLRLAVASASGSTQDSLVSGQFASHIMHNNEVKFQWVDDNNLWTSHAENLTKVKRFSETDKRAWRSKLAKQSVVALKQGCGRMQNRLAMLSDGTAACVRYRHNVDQIQGEIYTYALAELLHMDGNLAPTSLAMVDATSTQWKAVSQQLSEADWRNGQFVVMTQWLPDLKKVHIPQQLREKGSVLTTSRSKLLNVSDLTDLIQWSDMMMLDYLTANMDRFMNSLINQQWDRDIMSYSAHNLMRDEKRQLLVFIDNESSFYHGYNLLTKYAKLHEDALARMCVFRKSSIDALRRLAAASMKQLDIAFHQVAVRWQQSSSSSSSSGLLLPKLGQREQSQLRERMISLLKHIDNSCQLQ